MTTEYPEQESSDINIAKAIAKEVFGEDGPDETFEVYAAVMEHLADAGEDEERDEVFKTVASGIKQAKIAAGKIWKTKCDKRTTIDRTFAVLEVLSNKRSSEAQREAVDNLIAAADKCRELWGEDVGIDAVLSMYGIAFDLDGGEDEEDDDSDDE